MTVAVPLSGRKVPASVPLPPEGVIAHETEFSVAAAAFCIRFRSVNADDLSTGLGESEKFGTRSTCWIDPLFVTAKPFLYVARSVKEVAVVGTVTTVPSRFVLPGEKVQENVASAVLPCDALASPLFGLPARTWRTLPS